MNRNSDSVMATGVRGGMFDNDISTEANEASIRAEKEYIDSIVPTAQVQVDALNVEIASMNNLIAFINSLGGNMPTDVPGETLQAKLEARYAYIGYLLSRKANIVNAMSYKEHDVDDEIPAVPLPTASDVFRAQIEPELLLSRWQLLKRLFTGSRPPM